MSDGVDAECLAAGSSPMFVTCTIALEPGAVITYEPPAWDDAIVFITAGEIELECVSGTTHRFHRGAVLCFQRLPLRAVRNNGVVAARLVTLRRRASWSGALIG